MASNGKRPQGQDEWASGQRTPESKHPGADFRLIGVLAVLLVGVPIASADAQQAAPEHATPRARPILLSGSWEAQGNFQQVQVPPSLVHADGQHLQFWMAVPKGGPKGFLSTPPFAAPRILAFLVSGEIGPAESQVWVERLPDGQRLFVHTNSGHLWRRVAWELPPSWQGRMIRLVATNRHFDAHSWLGVSSPYLLEPEGVASAHWNSLRIVPQMLLALVLFLSPGLVVTLALSGRLQIPAWLLLASSILWSSLAGYGVFWVYFVAALPGRILGMAISLAAVGGLVLLLRSSRVRGLVGSAEFAVPLGLWLASALLYQGLALTADLGMPENLTHTWRFTDARLGADSQLPLLLATKLYTGDDPRHFFQDWHSSDRPPLQSGLVLQQMPVAAALGLPLPLYYQLLGCVLQCTWVPALWAVCRSISVSGGTTATSMVCVIFTGFALLGSVYAWPKMLAAALVLVAFALVLQAVLKHRSLSSAAAIGVGMGVALGPLAHGGAAFPCLALGIFAAYFGPTLGWRRLLVSLAVAVGLTLPWLAYQRLYDPPGNRLLKWHLAGAVAVDDRSFFQALVDDYGRIGIAGTLENKAANLKTLFVDNDKEHFGTYPPWHGGSEPIFATWRRLQFHQLAWGLGVLNTGWIVPLAALFRRRKLPRAQLLTLTFALLGLGLWIVLMFGPATTVIHQGPYATFLLLFALLAVWIVSLPRAWAILIVTAHIGCFLVVWILTSGVNSCALANGPMIAWCVLMAAVIAALAWSFARKRTAAPESLAAVA